MSRKRVRIKDVNNIPEAVRTLEEINGALVRVGVLTEGEIKMIATVHEFGIRITVTKKMRRFLASQGLHLKKSTGTINIPERSFIRAGWDENEKDILQKIDDLVREAVNGGISVDDVLDGAGIETQDRIRDYTRDLKSPANHPFTVERKGSSNPLVQDGDLIANIIYEIKK